MQHAWIGNGPGAYRLNLPDATQEVIPGVTWGSAAAPNTPAYWAARCRWPEKDVPDFTSQAGSLVAEVGFCLLGGFGIRYEANAAAFERLDEMGAFDLHADVSEDDMKEALLRPLRVEGRLQRYRFPNQRARRLAAMRVQLRDFTFDPADPVGARDRLMTIDGVGPKTASWIVRNVTGSDDVAIIDVHVLRACVEMQIFPDRYALPRDYAPLERRFLDFADAIAVKASVLDAVMWTEMRAS